LRRKIIELPFSLAVLCVVLDVPSSLS